LTSSGNVPDHKSRLTNPFGLVLIVSELEEFKVKEVKVLSLKWRIIAYDLINSILLRLRLGCKEFVNLFLCFLVSHLKSLLFKLSYVNG
jgi:hypothetical protein